MLQVTEFGVVSYMLYTGLQSGCLPIVDLAKRAMPGMQEISQTSSGFKLNELNSHAHSTIVLPWQKASTMASKSCSEGVSISTSSQESWTTSWTKVGLPSCCCRSCTFEKLGSQNLHNLTSVSPRLTAEDQLKMERPAT